MWVWGIRSGLSILDQGLTSGAGFLLNLLLARWLTSEEYGAFAVAFTTILFLFGFHTALLLEPMSVFGPSTYSTNIAEYFKVFLKLHAGMTMLLSFLLCVTSGVAWYLGARHELVAAFMGSALALPLLLLLWLVRRMCYVVHRPLMAVWGSASYFLLVVIGLFALYGSGRLTSFSAFVLIAVGSVPAVLVLLWQLRILEVRDQQAISFSQVVSENWRYGRWLVAGTVFFAITTQTQTYLTAALLGLGAAGILRALQIPSLFMVQIVTAVGLLVLPAMAREFGSGGRKSLQKKAAWVSGGLAAMALVYAGLLAIVARPLEQLLFGGKFSNYGWLIPVLGVVPVLTGFATGFSMALRAAQKPHFDLLANMLSAPVGLLSALIFIHFWGIAGAGLSLVAGFAVYAAVFCYSFLNWFASPSAHADVPSC
jgi:O-antigen/teichoic acid export membrane protein